MVNPSLNQSPFDKGGVSDFSVKADGSSYSKLLVVLLSMLMLFMTPMVIHNEYVILKIKIPNMTTPATLEELDTEEFSQIVIKPPLAN